jgi:hypothetical protein
VEKPHARSMRAKAEWLSYSRASYDNESSNLKSFLVGEIER